MDSTNNIDWESNISCFIDNINGGIKKYKLCDSTDYIDTVGIGYLVDDLLKWKCRYVVDDKKWYWYSDGCWKPDDFGIKVKEYVKIISNSLLDLYNFEFIKARMNNALEPVEKTIQKLSESEETKIFSEWKSIALVLRESKTRDQIIKEISSIDPLRLADFNTSPHLLNCTNCTIDLIKKDVLRHDPKLLLINTANVKYDEAATYEIWEGFIKEILQNNEENIRFLQKIIGYFLTGDISYERFFIFQGETNHKIIFIETILKMLGNYAITLEPETLSMKNSSVINELSRLATVRFININEISKGMELNASLINRIISGSTVTVKDKDKNIIEIKPKCKIGLTTNFLPKITDENIFKSGRINKLKLHGGFQENKQNRELINSFQECKSLSGILNWALKGLESLNAEGLNPPENVINDINEYRGNIDIIGEFIQSCFIKTDEKYKERSSQVYEQYKFWCRHNEFYYDYPQKFWAEMITRVRRTRSNKGHVIWGYKLISNYSWENPFGDNYSMSKTISRTITEESLVPISSIKEKGKSLNNKSDISLEIQDAEESDLKENLTNNVEVEALFYDDLLLGDGDSSDLLDLFETTNPPD